MSIDFGTGYSSLDFQGGEADIDGNINVAGGSDGALLQFGGDATVLGSITCTGSTTGTNSLYFGSTFHITGNCNFTGGTALDYITMKYGKGVRAFDGAVNWALGDGDNAIVLDEAEFNAAMSLTTGQGADTVTSYYGMTFKSNFTGSFGDGDNNLTMDSGEFDGLATITTGQGKDQFNLQGIVFKGNLQFTTGAGDDRLEFYDCAFDPTNGGSIFTMSGNDTVAITSTWYGDGHLAGVVFNLGGGDDRAVCDISSDPPSLIEGGAGTDSTNLPLDVFDYLSGFELSEP